MSSEREFKDSYVFGKTLGNGNFSVVKKCRHKFSKAMYAAKIITFSPENRTEILLMVKAEVAMVRKLKHPSILSFVDVYYDVRKAIIITELAEFGDLHDYILNQEKVDEHTSRLFALEISSAVNYMHSQNTVHRDIKPENFLLFKNDGSYTVKLCDFGLAEEVSSFELNEVCGSPSFVAPEILEFRPYGLPVDVWSMGIVFYFLLCKYCPFDHVNLNSKFKMVMSDELQFPSQEWSCISKKAKTLIQKMLVKVPACRITASKVLYDPWFQTPVERQSESTCTEKRTLSLKAAANVVKAAATLVCNTPYAQREDAVMSRKLIESTLSL